MKNNHHIDRNELKKIQDSGNSRTAACIATAGVTLIIGYVSWCLFHAKALLYCFFSVERDEILSSSFSIS